MTYSLDKPTISILMAAYKEAPNAVRAAVENMLAQTYPPLEVVVVLDNPENTAVRDLLEEWQAREERVRLVVHEKNRGLGAALNTAANTARGEWVARMDVGDRSAPERLAKQVAHLQQYPATDLLFTGWKEVYEDGSERISRPTREDFTRIKKTFFAKSLLLHASLLTRRQILLDHPYPEIGRPEDFVLFLKLIHAGYRFDVVEEVLYSYSVDRRERYQKIRAYARNLLPNLGRNIPRYWHNPWFWLYSVRVFGEYVVSRNRAVFDATHRSAAKVWKLLAR